MLGISATYEIKLHLGLRGGQVSWGCWRASDGFCRVQQTIFVAPAPSPLTLKNHQLGHVGPASGDEYEKREKTAC